MRKMESELKLKALTEMIQLYEKTFRIKFEMISEGGMRVEFLKIGASVELAFERQGVVS